MVLGNPIPDKAPLLGELGQFHRLPERLGRSAATAQRRLVYDAERYIRLLVYFILPFPVLDSLLPVFDDPI